MERRGTWLGGERWRAVWRQRWQPGLGTQCGAGNGSSALARLGGGRDSVRACGMEAVTGDGGPAQAHDVEVVTAT
ncbi:hypothetical protein E2562_019560 [Oryza meyeriana var. granulata]|uniref:Uncharacterized protein n=1 Tax=Oryza meyeriana var. granulata TaxID=110450 RepID=A0A6G1BYD6_9ORYZ|nr:hypothetical protein E2562_019560 [Oryza meyeriana var. granulata]